MNWSFYGRDSNRVSTCDISIAISITRPCKSIQYPTRKGILVFKEENDIRANLDSFPKYFQLTPVRGKKPYTPKWQATDVSRTDIESAIFSGKATGFGLRLGTTSNGVMALDIDGAAPRALISEIMGDEELPVTVEFTSGKPDRSQMLFQVPEQYWDVLKSKKRTIANGDTTEDLDFRWNGNQSVLPPSDHPETDGYQWIEGKSPDEVVIAQLPTKLLEFWVGLITPPNAKSGVKVISINHARSCDRTPTSIPIEWLLTKAHRKSLGGVSSGHRDNTGLKLACDLIGVESLGSIECDYNGKNYTLEIEQNARELFAAYCNGCIPPLLGRDEDRIWNSAGQRDGAPSIRDEESLKNCVRGYLKEVIGTNQSTSGKRKTSDETPAPAQEERKIEVDYPLLAKELGIVLVQDGKGNIKSKLVELTIDLFNLVGDRLKLNQMTQEYEYEGKQLDLNHIKNFISHNLGYDSITENCIQAVHAIASKFAFHPVHKYLESLRDIAIVDFELFNNIATLFLGNSDPLANKMMAKALIGAVARVNKPGTKVDTLPVLQGGQGFLKSTFLKVLSGKFWFCDDIRDLENKDELAKLARYWIIELAEVDYLMGRKEVESFKRFLSTTADTYRPPYGRSNIRHERTCTLFATTNKIEFLKDPTGSRRYWVIKVGAKIDCNLVAKFRDIIWATALAAYDRGDTWWLDDNDELAREERSEEFREPDAWEEIIDSKWDNLPIADYKGSDRVEIDRIFDLLDLDNDKRNKPNRNRIASILKLRGFENKTINTEAGKVKAWLRPRTGVDFTQEELTQNEDFKNKVLGKYSFLGSNSSITTSEKGFEVEPNMELNSLGNEKEDYHQNSSQHGESLELNLEPNYRNLELNYKQEPSVMESELSSTAKELSSSSCLIPEPFSAQKDVNPSILEPELSSISNAVPESILPLMEPKNLRKEPFHIVQKNNSEEITRFKVGDRVEIISTGERGKLGQWYRDRKKATVELDDGTISDWVEIADLRSLESEEIR